MLHLFHIYFTTIVHLLHPISVRQDEFDYADPRAGAIKRTGSGRMVDGIPTYSRPEAKPRSLSFRVAPPHHQYEQQQQQQQHVQVKAARYSETHFGASEDQGGRPPPLPTRSVKQRASEPVLFPSMPSPQPGDILGVEAQKLVEVSF